MNHTHEKILQKVSGNVYYQKCYQLVFDNYEDLKCDFRSTLWFRVRIVVSFHFIILNFILYPLKVQARCLGHTPQ